MGLILFQRFRDTYLWATTPAEYRVGLFDPASQFGAPIAIPSNPALAGALRALGAVVREPETVLEGELGRACTVVAEWCLLSADRSQTAQAFAELVAWVEPGNPDRATFAGRATRNNGDYERAALWYARAAGLARLDGDHPGRTNALLGWGHLEMHRGQNERARALFVRAWKLARKHKLRLPAAAAQHYLFVLAGNCGDYTAANEHAAIALRLYRVRDQRFPHFVHDLGFLWLLQRFYMPALELLEVSLRLFEIPETRFQVVANIARAAGTQTD